jgi:hypothetical protein
VAGDSGSAPATTNARRRPNPLSALAGCRTIGCMSLYHPKRYKLSFVESPTRTDVPSIQTMKMSTCSHQQMTNHHDSRLLSQLSETLHIWLGISGVSDAIIQ